jgi:hypothetical protein
MFKKPQYSAIKAKLVQKKPNFGSFWTGFGDLGRILGFFELWRIVSILDLDNNLSLVLVFEIWAEYWAFF